MAAMQGIHLLYYSFYQCHLVKERLSRHLGRGSGNRSWVRSSLHTRMSPIPSFIHYGGLYSASLRLLLRSTPDQCAATNVPLLPSVGFGRALGAPFCCQGWALGPSGTFKYYAAKGLFGCGPIGLG